MSYQKILLVSFVAVSFVGCNMTGKEKSINAQNMDNYKSDIAQNKPNLKIETYNAQSQNPQELYQKCISCHGVNGNKSALGVTEAISKLDEKTIKDRLKGYKNDTYGGVMKNLMKPQVSNLSEKQIEILAKYIDSFN